MQVDDRHAYQTLDFNREVFSIDDLEIVQYKTRFPVYTQMCRNLKEKAPSGSLLGDFDSRIKLNTFIETNVRVLPDVYLSLWIRIRYSKN